MKALLAALKARKGKHLDLQSLLEGGSDMAHEGAMHEALEEKEEMDSKDGDLAPDHSAHGEEYGKHDLTDPDHAEDFHLGTDKKQLMQKMKAEKNQKGGGDPGLEGYEKGVVPAHHGAIDQQGIDDPTSEESEELGHLNRIKEALMTHGGKGLHAKVSGNISSGMHGHGIHNKKRGS